MLLNALIESASNVQPSGSRIESLNLQDNANIIQQIGNQNVDTNSQFVNSVKSSDNVAVSRELLMKILQMVKP
jgi:hypothetical protein